MYPADIVELKGKKKIVMLTAYDYSMASILDNSSIDMILVGDSLGNVIQGQKDTIPVTIEDIIYHSKAVVKGARSKIVIADMPFMSTCFDLNTSVENVMRVMQETGVSGVKIEGGIHNKELFKRLCSAGVPVMGHLGLTPQSYLSLGGYKKQGKSRESYEQIFNDAVEISKTGIFGIVLECVCSELAADITGSINIPTIGIGSGSKTDGQVLVTNDLLGLTENRVPSFVKPKINLSGIINNAVENYVSDVRS